MMCITPLQKAIQYHGILFLVDKSGISLISPTAVRLVASAGPSAKEVIPIDANVKPTPLFTTTLLNRAAGTT